VTAEAVSRVFVGLVGVLVVVVALDAYWTAAEAAEPVLVLLSLLFAAVGLALLAKAGDRLL
jgi:hypothetical protein